MLVIKMIINVSDAAVHILHHVVTKKQSNT